MLPDDTATPQDGKADFPERAFTGDAVAASPLDRCERNATATRSSFTEH